ncbi:hypothetical protein OQX61_17830 [Pedobacter sp. PLR]|uniref:hypothetical protein n=1 Tax=Pedobacter sp. PLR TaxID=2994465 RepID=UPI00224768A9|nr:hypothetical protein [Pedobacter sp. PLR]MCX2453141.1 hypothetical protein [Pedobacter sp. PLR]
MSIYKYKIKHFLQNLTHEEYRIMWVVLPEILDVSRNTLVNYQNIKQEDHKDIPYQIVRKLEHIFGCAQGELLNIDVFADHYTNLVAQAKVNNPLQFDSF